MRRDLPSTAVGADSLGAGGQGRLRHLTRDFVCTHSVPVRPSPTRAAGLLTGPDRGRASYESPYSGRFATAQDLVAGGETRPPYSTWTELGTGGKRSLGRDGFFAPSFRRGNHRRGTEVPCSTGGTASPAFIAPSRPRFHRGIGGQGVSAILGGLLSFRRQRRKPPSS